MNTTATKTRLRDASLSQELVISTHSDFFFNGELMTGLVTNFFPWPCEREGKIMIGMNLSREFASIGKKRVTISKLNTEYKMFPVK